MRSIRRSLTGYLLILLAVTLAVVWVVIDQVTARSLEAREEAVAERIRLNYEERLREEQASTDKALLDQAKELGSVLQAYYYLQFETERAKSRAAMGSVQLALGPVPFATNPLAQFGWSWVGNHQPPWGARPHPSPWIVWGTYFANPPLPEEVIQHVYGEKGSNDFLQISTQSGRKWLSPSLSGRELPFDPKLVEGKSLDTKPEGKPEDHGKTGEGASLIDWVVGTGVTSDGAERVRRVLLSVPHFKQNPIGSGPRRGPPPGPPPRSMLGAWAAWSLAGFGPLPMGATGWPPSGMPAPPPTLDSLPRLYIQCARPQAALDKAQAEFAAERDEELARLRTDIDSARQAMRFQIAVVGLAAFLAVALGGPLLVGRGLRPVGKLSDAVSRVSEKDFALPHDGTELSVELAPIHARLTQTLDLLRRAFSREKQAVADISHELRTPIAALMATIDVALRKQRTPEQYRGTLEECRLISKQLSQLVERIMTLASLDAGNDRTAFARTDVTDLACGCAAVIRPLAAANGITVELRVDELIDLDTDAGKLREVLMNLLHNAIEYNSPNGTIDFSVRRENGSAVFEVRDSGIGMTPEIQDKIFERFYRADASRHATGVHAGLGLAIVKEYVARLNGTIAVESQPGVGSTFRVTLPMPASPPDADGRAQTADEPVSAAG
jgi:two-component system heavy metal sensor histidine kinase CusS